MVRYRWHLVYAVLPIALPIAASVNKRIVAEEQLHTIFATLDDHYRRDDRIGPGLGVCGKKIENPPSSASMDCPFECPYVLPDTNNFCSFSCVKKEDCNNRNPLTSFADPVTRVCSPCAVTGCVQCGYNRKHCVECGERMVLKDGECVAKYGLLWSVVYCVAGIAIAIILVYFICLALRPDVNHGVLKRAEEFRDNVKLKDRQVTDSEHKLKPYRIASNLTSRIVAGPGIMLHFSWQRYIIIWALIVTAAWYSLSWIPIYSVYPAVGGDTHPNDRDVFQTCAEVGSDKLMAEVDRAEWLFLAFTFGIYIFSTLGTFFLLLRHQHVFNKYERRVDLMRNYAVYATGFPESSGKERLEEKYKTFFKEKLPGVNIMGVSVVWNELECRKHSGLHINVQVAREIGILDAEYDRENGIVTDRSDLEKGRNCMHSRPCCLCIDNVFLGRLPCTEEQKPFEGDLLVEKLETMRSTGDCVIVFQTIQERNKVLEMKTIHHHEGFTIHLNSLRNDPRTIYWEHIGKQGSGRILRFLGMCVILFLFVGLWTLCIYWPYASYILQWKHAPGVGEERYYKDFLQTTLLTIPIVLGNQVMYAICDYMADLIRCETRGLRNLAYVVMYTVFITIQTVLDILIVLHVAYGNHSEDSWRLAQASGMLGPKAVAQNPSIRELLYVEMVGYLYPTTLGLCYLIEPFFLGVVPYLIFKWLIRSRADIEVQEAQQVFAPLPFDLSRYGDIIISVICCILVCFIATPDVYIIFVYLSGMLLFCYCWDHYRLLRLSQVSKIDTNLMDEYCTMMLAIPCALLAACVVFRRYGAHNSDFTRDSVPLACVIAYVIHLAIHMGLIQLLIWRQERIQQCEDQDMMAKTSRDEMLVYEEFAKDRPDNYFNTNWVNCLRSKYIYQHGDTSLAWCVPVCPGRKYLLMRAEEFAQYYDAEGVKKHKLTFKDDLKSIRKHADDVVKEVAHAFSNASDKITSSLSPENLKARPRIRSRSPAKNKELQE